MHVADQQAVFPADQVRLLNPVAHRFLQHVFAERHAGARSLPAPLEALRRYAVLDRFVDLLREIAQRVHDRFANRRTHHRVQRIGIGLRFVVQRTLQAVAHRLCQRLDQLAILAVTPDD